MRKGLAALLLVVAVLWASVAAYTETAFGHANQARSAPSPDSVLPDGTYTVAWKNVSTIDGHLVRGSFLFSVGEPISAASLEAPSSPLLQSPVEPVLRWLLLLSILTMVGGLVFDLLVSRPVLFARRADPPLRNLGNQLASRSHELLWVAIAVFLTASVAQLLLQTSIARDASILSLLGSPVWSMLTDTEWGRIWV